MTAWVHAFGGGTADGDTDPPSRLGAKGANLARMSRMGLPVPPGFTLTTDAGRACRQDTIPDALRRSVAAAMRQLESQAGARFGDPARPLLVSVRSGAACSMPGMMDTVLNLGLNAATVRGLEEASGDARFAWDTYRRFIQSYGSVVLGVDHSLFEDILEDRKMIRGIEMDTHLDAADLARVAEDFLDAIAAAQGAPFPEDVETQLWGALRAVFASWDSPRARAFRALHNLPEEGGTAATVQAMVFGNRGTTSATGVAFTRDPDTGEKGLCGEYLVNAQGEDVVAGLRTPWPLREKPDANRDAGRAMAHAMPDLFKTLCAMGGLLERHFRAVQDLEFTIQEGSLFLLQTRSARLSPKAALRSAVAMAGEGLITRQEAAARLDAAALAQLSRPVLDVEKAGQPALVGLGASPGAAIGQVVFTSAEAQEAAAAGRSVILVRLETSAEDISGMHAAAGLLTARGGTTSHAAVVARGLGRACVCGAGGMHIDPQKGEMRCGGTIVRRGDIITIDGESGKVFLGAVPQRAAAWDEDLALLAAWKKETR